MLFMDRKLLSDDYEGKVMYVFAFLFKTACPVPHSEEITLYYCYYSLITCRFCKQFGTRSGLMKYLA